MNRDPRRRPVRRTARRVRRVRRSRSARIEQWLWSEQGRAARRWLWTAGVLLCLSGYMLRHLETAGILLALPGGWLLAYLVGHHYDEWRAGR